MSYLIIGASLNPESNSQILAERSQALLQEQNHDVQRLDLREIELPMCDGSSAYAHPNVAELANTIAQASALVVATPIYNYDVNANIKNLLELTGKSWNQKIVGFLCAAGGKGSYMSVMPFANSLMLDFRCLIIPKFVYATGDSFDSGKIVDKTIEQRLVEFRDRLVEITEALTQPVPVSS